jgi:triosephosphate isomerase
MHTPIFAANWKMHMGPADATAFMQRFLAHYAPHTDRTVIIFPPDLSLCAVADATRERRDIVLGVQHIFWESDGAFTGECSAPIARQAGARCTLVGHSERRHIFGETDADTALKCAAAVAAGLVPMLCVGETIDERQRGESTAVVLRQLRAGVSALTPVQVSSIVVAYEPVWAIGTGHTARPEDATAMHDVIREALEEVAGDHGAHVPVLYGGSVKEGNASALLSAGGVDGLLVGGASLDAEGWARIVSQA